MHFTRVSFGDIWRMFHINGNGILWNYLVKKTCSNAMVLLSYSCDALAHFPHGIDPVGSHALGGAFPCELQELQGVDQLFDERIAESR